MRFPTILLALSLAPVALVSSGLAQSLSAPATVFASRVVALNHNGQAGGGIFNPPNLLGAPDGGVNSLGIGGHATVGFDVTLTDGPGADFIVSENAFFSGGVGSSFAEMMFVEVSSNGVDFARIPNAYTGPPVSPGGFGVVNVGLYEGMAGATPVNLSAADPQDVVDAGGDAIDLADLYSHSLVQSGLVDLNAITEVRLVDVRDGIDRDTFGRLIHDPGSGSADADSVTVIHHTANQSANGPRVDVVVPATGQFFVTFEDPDGWTDLDPASLHFALWGIPVNLADILPAMRVIRFDAQGFTLQLLGPLPAGFPLRVSASVKDRAGHRSGAARSRV